MLDRLADILRQVGNLLLDRRSSREFTFRRQDTSVSASVDIEAHNFLVCALSELLPGVPVLSEEDSAARSSARPDKYWLIDPLDGTASFVDGYAGFVTQAALIHRCQPVAAAVHAPAFDETYLAEAGGGAVRNGFRCRVQLRPITEWTLTDNYPVAKGIAADLMRDWSIPNYLECGSIGLKICRVAEGNADIFIKDVTVRDWDVAAPGLILEEAGGILTDGTGRRFPYRGLFENRGLLACTSEDIRARVVTWLKRAEIQ